MVLHWLNSGKSSPTTFYVEPHLGHCIDRSQRSSIHYMHELYGGYTVLIYDHKSSSSSSSLSYQLLTQKRWHNFASAHTLDVTLASKSTCLYARLGDTDVHCWVWLYDRWSCYFLHFLSPCGPQLPSVYPKRLSIIAPEEGFPLEPSSYSTDRSVATESVDMLSGNFYIPTDR